MYHGRYNLIFTSILEGSLVSVLQCTSLSPAASEDLLQTTDLKLNSQKEGEYAS